MSQKYRRKEFLVPNLRVFILHEPLCLVKFEGADLKFDNCFCKFMQYHMPNIAKCAIFTPTFKVFKTFVKKAQFEFKNL